MPSDPATRAAVAAVRAEVEGLAALAEALQGDLAGPFSAAVAAIAAARGRVVVCGIGKSGHVARKVAATFASTGTPAFFLHPAEASHGDLGMIARQDVLLALSWSGETPELRDVVSYAKRLGVPVLALTSEPGSALAKASDVALVPPRTPEACPIGLAPTTSTTVQMALGDALAIALLDRRGFSAGDFRAFHPGGSLGARLVRVGDLMLTGKELPRLEQTATLSEAIVEITRGRLGGVAIVDARGRLAGAFTDGDLRRALPSARLDEPVARYMTQTPVFTAPGVLASEALRLMTERPRPILLIFVCDNGCLVGAVHMHDLLRAGVS